MARLKLRDYKAWTSLNQACFYLFTKLLGIFFLISLSFPFSISILQSSQSRFFSLYLCSCECNKYLIGYAIDSLIGLWFLVFFNLYLDLLNWVFVILVVSIAFYGGSKDVGLCIAMRVLFLSFRAAKSQWLDNNCMIYFEKLC